MIIPYYAECTACKEHLIELEITIRNIDAGKYVGASSWGHSEVSHCHIFKAPLFKQ